MAAPTRRRPSALARIAGATRSLIEWLRAGYPDDAPRTGHSPLLALNGPLALSARQTAQIVGELGDRPTDSIDIGVAITKATDRLPTQTQIRTVTHALPPTPPSTSTSH
ncbi:DUF3349 domain-containing protein [Mycobacterium sp.]|uniref:DUF3349 domain-containing protein n=1 Tax=Mycobacterium sp. TaxID=1785 RepID=UPI003F9C5963